MSVEDALRIKDMEDIDIKIDTKLPLYPYQKVGSFFMVAVKKCFNLDDPGLGKTAQSIGYMKLLQKVLKKSNIKVLVVATSSILFQWESEVKKFSNLLPVVSEGGAKRRHTIYKNFSTNRQNVLIINYTKILHDFDEISKIKFDAIIFDEASSLKDSKSKIYKYYSWMTKKVDRVVMLTATPISNNLEEFYNLFGLFHMDFLPPYQEFRDEFLETRPITVNKNGRKFTIQSVVGSQVDKIPLFRQMVEPFFIRRLNTKESEFSHLKMTPIKHPILMTKEQKITCASLRLQFFQTEDAQALKLFSDFVKIACSPSIYSPELSNISPKAIELVKLIRKLNKKVVIFAKFIEFHQIIQDYLTKAGLKYVSITGEQTSREKEDNKIAFAEDPTIDAILLTGAGKFGLNLQITNQLIFVDLPYTPSDVFQYIGRVYRTGQEEDVDVHFLYHADSLEEDLFSSLERKQIEIDTFFEQNKSDIFKLDMSSDVNVKASFVARNYLDGDCYDDFATAEDYSLIPEKRAPIEQKEEVSMQNKGDFYQIDLLQL